MGAHWLESMFAERFEVVPVQLKGPFLHLDVVFNLVGDNIALVYPSAIESSSFRLLKRRHKLIEVTADEQFALATNVLSLSPTDVVADSRNRRVNDILRDVGLNVIETDFSEIAKIGGSFRCATCPLLRDPVATE